MKPNLIHRMNFNRVAAKRAKEAGLPKARQFHIERALHYRKLARGL